MMPKKLLLIVRTELRMSVGCTSRNHRWYIPFYSGPGEAAALAPDFSQLCPVFQLLDRFLTHGRLPGARKPDLAESGTNRQQQEYFEYAWESPPAGNRIMT